MRRFSLLAFVVLLFPSLSFCQAAPSDSQTLQALLSEVRQLRQELHSTTSAMLRTQILVYRVQSQEAVVARASQRLDDARSKLAEIQNAHKRVAAGIRQYEENLSRTENPVESKPLEDALAQLKARLEELTTGEGDAQAKESDSELQLRVEQAKLTDLQDRLDRLDKSLESPSSP